MKIFILPHAKQRMKERRITRKMVYDALIRPDESGRDSSSSWRFIAKKVYIESITKKKYLLLVIYEETATAINVVTIISTSKIDKYLN